MKYDFKFSDIGKSPCPLCTKPLDEHEIQGQKIEGEERRMYKKVVEVTVNLDCPTVRK